MKGMKLNNWLVTGWQKKRRWALLGAVLLMLLGIGTYKALFIPSLWNTILETEDGKIKIQEPSTAYVWRNVYMDTGELYWLLGIGSSKTYEMIPLQRWQEEGVQTGKNEDAFGINVWCYGDMYHDGYFYDVFDSPYLANGETSIWSVDDSGSFTCHSLNGPGALVLINPGPGKIIISTGEQSLEFKDAIYLWVKLGGESLDLKYENQK